LCRIRFMAPHLSRESLVRVFGGQGTTDEIRSAAEHVPTCKACLLRAADALAEVRESGVVSKDARNLIAFLDDKNNAAVARHLARGKWETLRPLSTARFMDRVRKVEAMQEVGVAQAALEEAETFLGSDPVASEDAADRALLILELLPTGVLAPRELRIIKAKAMLVKGNSRRQLGDWERATSHLAVVRELSRESRDEALEVRLFSIEASLAFDMGRLEDCLARLRKAEPIVRKAMDWSGLGRLQIQAASALSDSGSADEALLLAREAIERLGSQEVRLRFLAKFITVDCLVTLNRVPEAVLEFEDFHELYLECKSPVNRLMYRALEARLLDALGHVREAEGLFVEVAEGYEHRENYKTALRVRLALFEAVFKRGSLQKAAAICQEAIAVLRDSPAHPQMTQAWETLLDLTRRHAVTAYAISELRSYMTRHWVTPAEPPRLVRKVGRPRSG
jgi:tetratricopeptide (TPR) repeat protein